MEAILSFIPVPVAVILMAVGFISLAVGGIRLGYKATVKDLALELVEKAELSIMGSGQGAKKKKQVFAALRAKCPAAIRWAITDEVLDAVIEHAFDGITPAYAGKSVRTCAVQSRDRDHLRVCGEKQAQMGCIQLSLGSPPRMRGKAAHR